MADIFISYSRHDFDFAKSLAEYLTNKGLTVWWDFQLYSGERFSTKIEEEIANATQVIVLWSKKSVQSKWVEAEANRALELGKIKTFCLEDCRPPLVFTTLNYKLLNKDDPDFSIVYNDLDNITDISITDPETARASAEARFWIEIDGSDDIEDYRLYLKEFPDGPHVALAILQIRRLEKINLKQTLVSQDHTVHLIGSVAVKIGSGSNAEIRQMAPGKGKQEWFQDASFAPEMVVIPPGRFMMGSPESELERGKEEGPQHEVIISDPFAVGRFAVTFAEWDYFVAQSGRSHKADDEGWGRDHRPVINVNWNDARAYANWLSEKAGHEYRLLTEAEWEYVARAGTHTPFWWGEDISTEQANYAGYYTYGNGAKGQYLAKPVPVDSYEPNAWGLYNVHGNVWEWCEDAWHDSYKNAPSDGQAWLEDHGGDVGRRVLRGGSWGSYPLYLRSATRYWDNSDVHDNVVGFRLSRTLFSSGT